MTKQMMKILVNEDDLHGTSHPYEARNLIRARGRKGRLMSTTSEQSAMLRKRPIAGSDIQLRPLQIQNFRPGSMWAMTSAADLIRP